MPVELEALKLIKACKIYRSDRKAETYLYLAAEMDFSELPEDLQARFGEPAYVMDLNLSKSSKLARADVGKVLQSLEENGFYLQLPPKLPVEEEIRRRFTRP